MAKKTIAFFALWTLLFSGVASPAHAATSASSKLTGLILLQTQSYGRAWYVSPLDGTRYYLKDKQSAYSTLKNLSVPIVGNEELLQNMGYRKNHKGVILRSSEGDRMWYIHPRTLAFYEVVNPDQAFELVRQAGVGVQNTLLARVPLNTSQIVPDTAFADVAYAKYGNSKILEGKDAQVPLPLASLTKLMTALVLLDLNPDWDGKITVTEKHIDFPKQFVGDDQTSEVPIREGMRVSFHDLWKAMLVASSNQAAAALADSSGLSADDFVRRMNAKARQLGLTKTQFFDCAGLDANNVSTAEEMAKLAYAAFQNAPIREGTHGDNFYITATLTDGAIRKLAVKNRNYSLLTFEPDASKTGFLVEAQRNVALLKNGATIVVLHARSMRERNTIIKKLL